jgi:hypothetical protein
MFILALRSLWPFIGIGLSLLIPLALEWPLWVGLLLLVPVLWLTHLAMTWLAIAALRAGTSQHARELIPDLKSLGVPATGGSAVSPPANRQRPGGQAPPEVAELVRVIEGFAAEDLGAMALARSHAAPAGYEATRKTIMARVANEIRSSGQFEDHVTHSHAAVVAVRAAVERAIDRIADLQPSTEFEAQMLEHASDLARYVVLKPRLTAADYRALWAPYRAVVPELATAARVDA